MNVTTRQRKALARFNAAAICTAVIVAHGYLLSSYEVIVHTQQFLKRFVFYPAILIFVGFVVWYIDSQQTIEEADVAGEAVAEGKSLASYLRRNAHLFLLIVISIVIICLAQISRSYDQLVWWLFFLSLSVGRDFAIFVRRSDKRDPSRR